MYPALEIMPSPQLLHGSQKGELIERGKGRSDILRRSRSCLLSGGKKKCFYADRRKKNGNEASSGRSPVPSEGERSEEHIENMQEEGVVSIRIPSTTLQFKETQWKE